jgi:hypothetical protein
VTVAPEILNPVLSATVPEKLPVACPNRIGHIAETLTQITRRKNTLRAGLKAKQPEYSGDTALVLGQFIKRLLSMKA